MTLRGPVLRAVALAALVAGLAAARPARAQSKSDAFAGKIPPVSGQLFRKAGRFELTLGGNLSLNDAFFTKYFGGAKLGYHFTEFLSASASFASGATARTNSAVTCPTGEGCGDATDEQLFQVPGNLRTMSGLELAWSPVYGKLNVFSERVAHFDVSLLVGADWIAYEEIVDRAAAAALALADDRPGTATTFVGHVGLGVRVFLSEWIAARLEFKDYVYRVPVPNWTEGDAPRSDIQNQLFTELGVSIFFPFQNRPVR
jgi:outer membrane beta-barrel protein